MKVRFQAPFKPAVFFVIGLIFSTACSFPALRSSSLGEPLAPSNLRPGVFPVDPIFKDFYAYLGGAEVLGPAISPLREEEGVRRQYVEKALLVYDPQATHSDRYRLAPLGKTFEVAEPPVPRPHSPEVRYIAGHIIDPGFLPLYESLGGARFVGRPITEVRHNPDKMRVEQYFENLGFYRRVDDPAGEAHLLAYGAFACDRNCRYSASGDAIPEKRPPLPEPFAAQEAILGLSFVGLTLSEPYEAPDGKSEVIFENIVLAADPEAASGVLARPIVELLGIEPQPMGACQIDPLAICLPGEEGRGYMIPVYFHEYIQRHGGWQLFGMPITQVYLVDGGVYRQCYTNLCLDFELDGAGENRLRPVPLGKIYKDSYYDIIRRGQFEEDFEGIHFLIWEEQPIVASGKPQKIHLAVSENEVPLTNREPLLTLTLPDGSRETYHFPPTDREGQTVLEIPPVDAPNGTLIPYEVCLMGIYGKTFCVGENYLIWNLP